MKWSLRIGTLLGIPIYLHISFLFILPVFAWVFAFQSATLFGLSLGFGALDLSFIRGAGSEVVRFLLGVLAATLFFGSVIMHELGHSAVALRYKAKIRAISLMIFGGVSQLEEIPREPGREFRVAIAGPTVSFAIGAATLGLLQIPYPKGVAYVEILVILLGIMAFYNVLLGLFNLIPAFPMDGGRVLRSLLARRMSYLNATESAAAVGKAFAIFFGIFGLFYAPWLILIALFVYLGAGEEERLTRVTVTLEGVTVADVMTPEVVTVTRDLPVSELLERMIAEKHMGYPVVDGALEGIVTFGDVTRVPAESRARTRVEDIMSRDVTLIDPRAQAMDALRLMSEHKVGRLPVMREGRIVGIVTRSDIVKSVSLFQLKRAL